MPIAILSYSRRSRSARALADALGATLVKRGERIPSGFKYLCWGIRPDAPRGALNPPGNVSLAVNKLSTLRIISEGGAVRTPEWTTSKERAKEWARDGCTVMCRTSLMGHSGNGIVIARRVLDLVDAPLYTKYIDKDSEWRIHVFDGEVIDQRQKVPASDGRHVGDGTICTHSNGYVFRHAYAPTDAKVQAIAAIKALGLDFGAVDVVVKHFNSPGQSSRDYSGAVYEQRAYVLEVNTAPGLEGSTKDYYAQAIKRKFNE